MMKKNKLIFVFSILQGLCWHHVNAQFNFKPFQTYSAGNGTVPSEVALGDLNNDGKPDIAAPGWTGGHIGVSILNNNGDGTFAPPNFVNLTGAPSDDEPWYVSIEDLNGDSYPDMVTSNSTFFPPGSISVFLNDGTGNFPPPVFYQSGFRPGKAIIKDFNGDNKPDIVVANQQDTFISVYMNNGNGAFSSQLTYYSYSPRVLADDSNNDGKADLVVSNPLTDSIGSDESVSIMFNDGNGGFTVSPPVITNSSSIGLTEIADLNNDNEPDLIFYDAGVPKRFLTYFNTGSAAFGSPVSYFLPDVTKVVAIDMNNDNKKDLVTNSPNSDFNYIFMNAGNGVMNAPIEVPARHMSEDLCVADLNGDSKLDFVNGTVRDSLISVTLQDNNTSINIPDLAKSDVNVFPNPGKEMVTVLSSINDRLSVYDAVGRLLIEHVIVKGVNAIDISSLSSGFYIFEVGEQKIKFEKRK